MDEVKEILDDLEQEVAVEVEAELLNAAHTNVLLLQQVITLLRSVPSCYFAC